MISPRIQLIHKEQNQVRAREIKEEGSYSDSGGSLFNCVVFQSRKRKTRAFHSLPQGRALASPRAGSKCCGLVTPVRRLPSLGPCGNDQYICYSINAILI